MDTRLLIDAVVHQTTVLIAQLATSAGIRAPLAHIADQVFLELAHEIEQQGVTRQVAADMFGIALRSYQRKVSRLQESRSVPERTLWQAVLEFVTNRRDAVTRDEVLAHFERDGEEPVIAVLGDLVANGLLFATGRGKRAAYGATTRGDKEALLRGDAHQALVHFVWLELASPPGLTRAELSERLPQHAGDVDTALQSLLEAGRVRRDDAGGIERFRASDVLIPVGSEAGWETALLDHFKAVCGAMVAKLGRGGASEASAPFIGGTTWSFEIQPGHPLEHEVKHLLTRVRAEVSELWDRLSAHNREHPLDESRMERVVFYAGQNWIHSADTEEE